MCVDDGDTGLAETPSASVKRVWLTIPVESQVLDKAGDTFKRKTAITAGKDGERVAVWLGQRLPAPLTYGQQVFAVPHSNRAVKGKLYCGRRDWPSVVIGQDALTVYEEAARTAESCHVTPELRAMNLQFPFAGSFVLDDEAAARKITDADDEIWTQVVLASIVVNF